MSWTPYHADYREVTLPAYQWEWIDQIATYITNRPESDLPTDWESDLVVFHQPSRHDRRSRTPTPTSEHALCAALQSHTWAPDWESLDRDLKLSFLSTSSRVLFWERGSTWMPHRTPYVAGRAQDYFDKTILAVEPMWVRAAEMPSFQNYT